MVRGLLDDFGRQVRQGHSFDEVEAHRDEVATLIVAIARGRPDCTAKGASPPRVSALRLILHRRHRTAAGAPGLACRLAPSS